MRKSTIMFIIAFLLMALPTFAQDSPQWSAYLFDNINNALIHVSSSAETQSFSLGTPTGSYIYGMSINSDDRQVAYCYIYRTDPNAEGVTRFVVRDIDREANLLEQELGPLTSCSVTAFNTDVLALSLVYAFDMNHAVGKLWELRLIDPHTGESLAVLDNENPAMPAIPMLGMPNVPILAKVSQLDRETVHFVAIPAVGTEGPPVLPAFEWKVSEGTIGELPAAFGSFNADSLPETGEVVFGGLDESLPAAMPAAPIPQANVVKILDADGERTIYQNSEWVISSTTFVNNGQSVLVGLFPGYDEQNPDGINLAYRYVLLNRNGSTVEFVKEFTGSVSADAIPGGAIVVNTPSNSTGDLGPTEIHLMNSDGSLSFHTAITVDYSLGWSSPQLVWTSASAVASDLSPFVGQ